MSEYFIPASSLMPEIASQLWPDVVPVAGVVIISGLGKDGQQNLYVLHDSDSPRWTQIGMLRAVEADMIEAWTDKGYYVEEDDE